MNFPDKKSNQKKIVVFVDDSRQYANYWYNENIHNTMKRLEH